MVVLDRVGFSWTLKSQARKCSGDSGINAAKKRLPKLNNNSYVP